MNTRIVIADDHEMMRAGLRSILEKQSGFEVVGEASDGLEAVWLAAQLQPHIVLMDIAMPLMNGVEATRRIAAANRDVKVVALSVNCEQSMISEMFRAGASSYLLKNSASTDLLAAIRAAQKNETYLSTKVAEVMVTTYIRNSAEPTNSVYSSLTSKQREVVQLLAEGKSNKEIAECLSISTKTVETHRAQIKDKLRIGTIAGLTKYAIRAGLTSIQA
jgi:DNA-binding NarL/FixJ family response regulator